MDRVTRPFEDAQKLVDEDENRWIDLVMWALQEPGFYAWFPEAGGYPQLPNVRMLRVVW